MLSARLRLGLLAISIAHKLLVTSQLCYLYSCSRSRTLRRTHVKSPNVLTPTPLPPPSLLPFSLRLGSQPTAGGAAVCSIPLTGTFVFARPKTAQTPKPSAPAFRCSYYACAPNPLLAVLRRAVVGTEKHRRSAWPTNLVEWRRTGENRWLLSVCRVKPSFVCRVVCIRTSPLRSLPLLDMSGRNPQSCGAHRRSPAPPRAG